LIVHVASVERLSDAIAWPPSPVVARQLERLADFWPGPLTVVCPRSSKIPDEVTAGLPTVAVRIPGHEIARKLLQRCPFPLAAPSANRSGYISPTLAEHVCDRSGLGDAVSLVLDGGPCLHGVESTILLLGEHPRLLRPGSITAEQLAERLGIAESALRLSPEPHNSFAAAGIPQGSTVDPSTDAALLGPGMLREHYAPTTPLVLIDPTASPDARLALISQGPADRPAGNPSGNGLGRISFRELSPREAAPYRVVETLSHRGDLVEVARNLFAALRRLDAMGLAAIHCDTCQPLGLGRAIMDRLDRAAARWQ
jgi:L-threonylcarbamoyladenylate synthase